MNKKSMEERWASYMAAYAVQDETERKQLLEQCVSTDVVFTNPSDEGKSPLTRMVCSAT